MFDTYSFFVGYLSDTAVNEDHHMFSAFTNRCGKLCVYFMISSHEEKVFFRTSVTQSTALYIYCIYKLVIIDMVLFQLRR